ncbi:unnamed protein product [Sphagnum jensenii]
MTILCPHREEIPEDMDLYYLQGKYLQGLMKDMGKPRLRITAAARGGAITPNKRTRTWEKENNKVARNVLPRRRILLGFVILIQDVILDSDAAADSLGCSGHSRSDCEHRSSFELRALHLRLCGMDRCHEYSFSQQQQHLTTK